VAVDYSGHFGLTQTPGPLAPMARSSFASRIEFPAIVALGYGLRIHERASLEIDAEWLQFSRFDRLPLHVGAPPPGLPAGIRQAWKDTLTAGIAGDWRVSPSWTLRAGYQFYQSPVPDNTLSPTIPDADQNVVTVGVAWRGKRHALEASYGRVFYEDRQIQSNQNPAFLGRYSTEVHLISLTYRLSL
jgi:long-chain fatty acid transport protein